MQSFLSPAQRAELDLTHKSERMKRYADRVKAILALDAGWSFEEVAEILRYDAATIRRFHKAYIEDGIDGLVKDSYTGGVFKLTAMEEAALKLHLTEVTYASTRDIAAYIEREFDAQFSMSGLCHWLKRNGFSYIKPKVVPGKADVEKQRQFLRRYNGVKSQLGENDKIYFADASHPIHQAVAGYGWMLKGNPKELKTNAERNRLNLNGAIDPMGLDVVIRQEKTMNSLAVIGLLEQLEKANPLADKIYVICDNARYYKSKEVRLWVEHSRIKMLYLPAYSPNLNLAERLWKYFRAEVMANVYYAKFDDFKRAASEFSRLIRHRRDDLATLLTENFEVLPATV